MDKKSEKKHKHDAVDGRGAVSGLEAGSNGQRKMRNKEYEISVENPIHPGISSIVPLRKPFV